MQNRHNFDKEPTILPASIRKCGYNDCSCVDGSRRSVPLKESCDMVIAAKDEEVVQKVTERKEPESTYRQTFLRVGRCESGDLEAQNYAGLFRFIGHGKKIKRRESIVLRFACNSIFHTNTLVEPTFFLLLGSAK